MKEYIYACNNGTKIRLTDEQAKEGDHILMFDRDELIITKMTNSTNIDNVIGKVKEMCHYM